MKADNLGHSFGNICSEDFFLYFENKLILKTLNEHDWTLAKLLNPE